MASLLRRGLAFAATISLVVVSAACKSTQKDSGGPSTADPSTYTRLTVAGDPDPTGIFDPYVVYDAGASDGWMAYSGVMYHSSGGNLVQDVQTNIAHSTDHGATWTFVQTAAPPQTNVTMTPGNNSLCGASTCTGHFIAEVPFLVDDPSDPDTSKRWKLFEHRYFLYPPGQAGGTSLQYGMGAIYMQTAASPDGTWTPGSPVLVWDGAPPEIPAGGTNLATAGANCIAISEGSGFARTSEIDVVFACIYPSGSAYVQKLIELRSTDHAASFSYVADSIATGDVSSIGGMMPTGSGLAWDGTTAHLLVTPIDSSGAYAGCASVVLDPATGAVARSGSDPDWDEIVPTQSNRFGGACAWAPGATADGIVMIQLDLDGSPADPFRIYETHVDP